MQINIFLATSAKASLVVPISMYFLFWLPQKNEPDWSSLHKDYVLSTYRSWRQRYGNLTEDPFCIFEVKVEKIFKRNNRERRLV